MATLGKFSPIPHPWTNLEVFTTFLSYQFNAFFSYFYTLKHKNFRRIEKHWWHLQAEHAFINRKRMKMGYSFRQTEAILTHERKVLKQEAKLSVSNLS